MSANEQGSKMQDTNKKPKRNEKSKFFSFIILLLIILIWLVIFVFLIKLDVGGFGTTLRPIIKDIPGVNKVLPDISDEELAYEKDYPYSSLEDAMAIIDQLEEENGKLSLEIEEYKNINNQLEEEIASLDDIKQEVNKFNERVLEFDREIVLNEKAPSIEEYIKYYQSINPENAEIIYRQVVKTVDDIEEIKKNANIYNEMDPRAAASIFESLSNDTDLLIKILSHMNSESTAEILSEMNPELAAVLTKKLFDN